MQKREKCIWGKEFAALNLFANMKTIQKNKIYNKKL